MLPITSAAAELVRSLAQEAGVDPTLRVRVIGGGCQGLTWEFEIGSGPRTGDAPHTESGVTVLVDAASAPYLRGGRVDLGPVQPNLLRHPLATAAGDQALRIAGALPQPTCGCGESFAAFG
jgi:iron-sulfur cluster assembly protein